MGVGVVVVVGDDDSNEVWAKASGAPSWDLSAPLFGVGWGGRVFLAGKSIGGVFWGLFVENALLYATCGAVRR